jgi:hypothetical protein
VDLNGNINNKKKNKMGSRDFAYWLMGYFEVSDPKEIGPKETEMIKKHLALVFKHEIDPSMGDDKHQQLLNEIHTPSNLNRNEGDVVYRC